MSTLLQYAYLLLGACERIRARARARIRGRGKSEKMLSSSFIFMCAREEESVEWFDQEWEGGVCLGGYSVGGYYNQFCWSGGCSGGRGREGGEDSADCLGTDERVISRKTFLETEFRFGTNGAHDIIHLPVPVPILSGDIQGFLHVFGGDGSPEDQFRLAGLDEGLHLGILVERRLSTEEEGDLVA